MKKIILTIILCFTAIIPISCSKQSMEDDMIIYTPEKKSVTISENNASVVSSNTLSIKMLNNMNIIDNENVLISPFSIATTLCLTENGATNNTKKEFRTLMNLEEFNDNTINEDFKSYIIYLNNINENKIYTANSMWINRNRKIKFEEPFMKIAKDNYYSEIKKLDFSNDHALDTINRWCCLKTNGKIKQALSNLDDTVVLKLINTIYFNGTWREEFNPAATYSGDFIIDSDDIIKTQTMVRKNIGIRCYENEQIRAAILPYYGDFSMNIIMPKENINNYLKLISFEKLNETINNCKYTEVNLELPKFKFDTELRLKKILKHLGLEKAFSSEESELHGLYKNAYIDEINHKSYISVDEKGTEAVAITIEEGKTSAKPEEKPKDFKINHPFIFTISDNSNSTILFIGKIENPALNN